MQIIDTISKNRLSSEHTLQIDNRNDKKALFVPMHDAWPINSSIGLLKPNVHKEIMKRTYSIDIGHCNT